MPRWATMPDAELMAMINSEVPTAMAIGMPSANASAERSGTAANAEESRQHADHQSRDANLPDGTWIVLAGPRGQSGAFRSHMRTATTSIKTPNRSKIQAPATR